MSSVTSTIPARAERYQLTLRRVFILPTRHGLTYCVMLVVMLLGAINYASSMGYMLTFLLTGVGLAGMIHTWGNLAGLVITPGRSTPVFAGDIAEFKLNLDNTGHDRRVALYLNSKIGASGALSLGSNAIRSIAIRATASRRGLLECGRVTLETRYPLGLFRAWSYHHAKLSVVVWPRPAGALPLPGGNPDGYQYAAGTRTGTEDFHGFRDYVPGDSPRHVHWKAMARNDKPIIKTFIGDSGAEMILNWEDTAALGNIDARLSQMCQWLLQAHQAGFRYGLSLPGITEEPANSEAHRQRCLNHLALWDLA